MKKKTKKILIILVSSLLGLFLIIFLSYKMSLSPVGGKTVIFTVNSGDTVSYVIANLKEQNLIKNSVSAKVYAKLHNLTTQTGVYKVNPKKSTGEILKMINDGKTYNNEISVTFIEGKRLTDYASVISANFPYSEEEVMNQLDDKTYLNELINKYSFLETDILKEGIYHPLEGYLFPDTYSFYKTATIKEIIETMLNNTERKLNELDEYVKTSSFSIHELMTLASIVELEGAGTSDRAGIAGVFYNRLNQGIPLGSDVTTYYSVHKDFTSDLKVSELNSCNGYNTRNTTCVPGLPIGPIASPGIDAIKAVLNPKASDYLYFVADKNGNIYYSKTDAEHVATVDRLKREGLWYTY